jgi:ubiquinone/menaquinone biosynthesis C-methylase UbiE
MENNANQHYLLKNQYKDASHLNARIALHERFSTNPQDWHGWIFEHLNLTPGSRILELGCGPGDLWAKNLEQLPEDCQIVLSDFSDGMLQTTRNKLNDSAKSFRFQVIDAQSIPYEDDYFDCVIANHMLYHVPNRIRAITEVRRVLRSTGRFYASTNGKAHLQEIDQLSKQAGLDDSALTPLTFTLENAPQQLSTHFSQIQLHLLENALAVTEAEPLVAFTLSSANPDKITEQNIQTLRDLIEQGLAQAGVIHVTKATGLFEAWGQKVAIS